MNTAKAAPQHIEPEWLPEGWTSEEPKHWPDLVYVERPRETGGGAVSLDFKLRVWDSGIQCPRRFPSSVEKKQYGGRNWKRQMVKDACEWLEMVMTRNEGSSK